MTQHGILRFLEQLLTGDPVPLFALAQH